MHPVEEIELHPYKEGYMEDIPELGQRMIFHATHTPRDYLIEYGQWKEMLQAYLASTTWADHQVGRVLQALEESPYADNMIIVLFSDHGYHLKKNLLVR
ncbi:MAG: sulfatase-like hydrolase/transferase [Balneolaceae bacterium]|nr:sulfatase-like hydrolase/transferase [Balneolaceae bacterium]